MKEKVTTPVVKGLVIGLVLVVLGVAAQLLEFDTASWFRWLSTLLLFGAIIYACILYSNQNNNNVTFGNIFADGFKTTAVITCISILTTVILIMVMPELKQRMFDIAASEAEKSGASDDIIEKQQEIFAKMFWVFVVGGIMVTYVVVGVIASLIGAGVAKKRPADPFQQTV